ncbi:MAG: zinc-ribbon domain-containing protein [Acutalibacteraceae bacterium]|nr:zinc-ribbon domain-containing protein [Acutalibacteraceae bacterium]
MFCSNCGTKLNSDAVFCKNCGAKVGNTGNTADVNNSNENPVVAKLKELFSSKLMLAIAILISCAFVFSMVSSNINNVPMIKSDDNVFYSYEDGDYSYYDYDDDYDDYYYNFEDTLTGSSQSPGIWVVLTLIGAWLVYSTAKSRNLGMKTYPFTFFKVCNLVVFIVTTVLLSVCLIVFLILATIGMNPQIIQQIINELSVIVPTDIFPVGIDYNLLSSAISALFIVLVVVCAGIMVLEIFIYLKANKTIVSIRDAAKLGEPANAISPFIAVMCFIGAANTIFSGLTNPFFDFTSAASFICYGTALILIGILLFKLRNEMACFVPVYDEPVLEEQPVVEQQPVAEETEQQNQQ